VSVDSGPSERLDEQKILASLPAGASNRLRSFTVLSEVDSTNRYLLERKGAGEAGVHACVAEMQTAGRGRRGRAWLSPFGANLYLSVLRSFPAPAESLQGLSLAVGVAVARAMQFFDVPGIALKWPNDILLDGKKLGGILLEISTPGAASCRVVAGIGVNIDMPENAGASIDQPWTDLAAHGAHPGRNRLASRVLAEVIMAEDEFSQTGFEAFHRDWGLLDALRDREVVLQDDASKRWGTARGVDASGALLLEVDGQCQRIVSGDISLRVAR
jgi:BirA family biotin operon repressor/biotin-[acetyl-CoA-carboxylase] ligase